MFSAGKLLALSAGSIFLLEMFSGGLMGENARERWDVVVKRMDQENGGLMMMQKTGRILVDSDEGRRQTKTEFFPTSIV